VVDKVDIGATMQFDWLNSKLDDDSGNKYIIFTHIYAGGRFKHDDSGEK